MNIAHSLYSFLLIMLQYSLDAVMLHCPITASTHNEAGITVVTVNTNLCHHHHPHLYVVMLQ
jgi:hypothetical protein